MTSLLADLRIAVRALRATPGQSLNAALALALGVAAAVTLYTAFRVAADDLPPIPRPAHVARLYFADDTTPVGRRPLRAADVGPLVDQVSDRVVVAVVRQTDAAIEIEGCAIQTAPVTVEQVEGAVRAGQAVKRSKKWRKVEVNMLFTRTFTDKVSIFFYKFYV